LRRIFGPTQKANGEWRLKTNEELLFTLQREQHGRINFLDLTITKGVSKLTFEVFRKPAGTETIIPNDSYRPLEQKLAAIRYLANRIQTYTLDHLQKQKETDIVMQIIHNNKYNTSILKRIYNNKKHKQGYKQENQNQRWVKFTYIGKET
jgi:hypothetical protein